jgi:acetyl esterase
VPLVPQAQRVLDLMTAAGVELDPSRTPDQVRKTIEAFASAGGPGEDVHRVEDRELPGSECEIPVRVYWPSADANLPVLLWFHGGGWTIGSLETADPTSRALANAAECIVVSVDYRLGPEHRFPAAVGDCLAVALGVDELAADLGGDPARVAIGGDSAGGNLAAVTTLLIRDAETKAQGRDRAAPRFVFQLLVYPAVEVEYESASMHENATGYFLTADSLRWFYGHYLGSADPRQWQVSPLLAPDVSGLPPALVITAEFDPLRDQGIAYAKRLADAGVQVDSRLYDGVFHGFFGMQEAIDVARDAFIDATAALRAAFGN